eukprot:SAG25_NODE_1234_length_3531_cov_5.241841_7_plen_51_part_00
MYRDVQCMVRTKSASGATAHYLVIGILVNTLLFMFMVCDTPMGVSQTDWT